MCTGKKSFPAAGKSPPCTWINVGLAVQKFPNQTVYRILTLSMEYLVLIIPVFYEIYMNKGPAKEFVSIGIFKD